MECKIREKDVVDLPDDYDQIWISHNSSEYLSKREQASTFCRSNSINSIQIHPHHITLRSMNPLLPLLSGDELSAVQGLFKFSSCQSDKCFSFVVALHLCDTKGCISEDHLITATKEENISRELCVVVFIQMYQKKLRQLFF
jgi:hypothetical protein